MDSNAPHLEKPIMKRWHVISAATTVVIILVAGILINHYVTAPSFPVYVQQQATFSLYYPTALPPSYVVDEATYSYKDGVLQFTISGEQGDMVVTQQKKPAGFDVESVRKGNGMTEVRTIAVPDAQAIIGTVLGRQTAIVVKPQTMITIVNTGKPVEGFENILQNLSKSK